MNLVFDVDERSLGYGGSLRPMVSDIFPRKERVAALTASPESVRP